MSIPSRQRNLDFPALFILLSALMTAAGRLHDTDWTKYLGLSYGAAALGLLIGLLLGLSRFRRSTAFWLAGLYSGLVLMWLLSLTVSGEMTWLTRFVAVANRVAFALVQFGGNEAVDDPILFLGWITSLYWLAGLLAGFLFARRGNLIGMLAPGGLLVTLITLYDAFHPERVWFIGLYLFLAVLLFGRLDYIDNAAAWQSRNFSVDPETHGDLALGVIVSALVIVLVAWNMPLDLAPSATLYDTWRELTRPFNRSLERLSDMFAPLSGTTSTGGDFYANTLALGLGTPLSDQVVFIVDVPPEVYDQPRFYWRGRVYDQYASGAWQTSELVKDNVAPIEDDLPVPDRAAGTLAIFNITTYVPSQRLLYPPAQPVWINRAVEASFFAIDDVERDIVALRVNRSLDAGDNYQARAVILNPPISQLRSAGTDYPEWVRARYLQLPDNFSERIQALARSLTQDLDTPYDKASAITNYLRDNITYAERIEFPAPAQADVMEWFLFESRQGFCNYYATAEVLMLRAVGIPARLAVGFAQGEASANRTRYFVRQKDAHAWPEVYFPGVGWVEFEPTVNQTPILRPASPPEITTEQEPRPGEPGAPVPTPTPATGAGDAPADPAEIARRNSFDVLWIGLILMAIAGGGLLLFRNTHRAAAFSQRAPQAIRALFERYKLQTPRWLERWIRWNNLSAIERAFDAVNQALRHLAAPLPASATPAERCEALKKLLPNNLHDIDTLLREHHLDQYSPHQANATAARRAGYNITWIVFRIRIVRYFS